MSKRKDNKDLPGIFLREFAPHDSPAVATLTVNLDEEARIVSFRIQPLNSTREVESAAAVAAFRLAIRSFNEA